MRRNLIARISAVVAALMVLGASAAVAQLDEDLVEPTLFKGIETTLVLNANEYDSINQRIDQTLREAHRRVGGTISSNERRNTYTELAPLPDRLTVVRAARDEANSSSPDIVFVDGGDSQSTVGFAGNFPDTFFVDLDQPTPCVGRDGRPDRTGACAGGESALPFNYALVTYDVEDPAYLAGVVAASASANDRLGIISGMSDCNECNRYIQGFMRGALSVEPGIDIKLAYLADDDEEQAFSDPTSGRTFAQAFIDVYQPDVLLPIAGDASIGMIEAACESGIQAVGTGIDVTSEHPELETCVIASITKDVETAVRDAMYDFTAGSFTDRTRSMTLEDGGVALTDEWQRLTTLPVDTPTRYQAALDGLITGAVESCPADCGAPVVLAGGNVLAAAAVAEAATADAAEDESATG